MRFKMLFKRLFEIFLICHTLSQRQVGDQALSVHIGCKQIVKAMQLAGRQGVRVPEVLFTGCCETTLGTLDFIAQEFVTTDTVEDIVRAPSPDWNRIESEVSAKLRAPLSEEAKPMPLVADDLHRIELIIVSLSVKYRRFEHVTPLRIIGPTSKRMQWPHVSPGKCLKVWSTTYSGSEIWCHSLFRPYARNRVAFWIVLLWVFHQDIERFRQGGTKSRKKDKERVVFGGLGSRASTPLGLLHQDINCGNLLTSQVGRAGYSEVHPECFGVFYTLCLTASHRH